MNEAANHNPRWAFFIIGFLTLLTLVTHSINEYYIYLAAYLWFGFVYGMCLQYGRVCFSSGFCDLFAGGGGTMAAMGLLARFSSSAPPPATSTSPPAPSGPPWVIAGWTP